MRMTTFPITRRCALAALALLPMSGVVRAQSTRDLKWADLVPPAAPAAKPRSLFSGAAPLSSLSPPLPGSPLASGPGSNEDNEPPPPYRSEGKWMSEPSRRRASGPPAVVTALDGQRVRLGGYVVALDFDATKISEFLLVPFVGACIHVPPPPANQIVYVKTGTPFDIKGQFTPVWVTGTIRTELAFTGLADAGYSMTDTLVTARPE